MNNREWERFGEEIRRNVQDAVDSRDFSRLSQTIMNTVNEAADMFARNVRDVGSRMGQNIRMQRDRYSYGPPYGQYGPVPGPEPQADRSKASGRETEPGWGAGAGRYRGTFQNKPALYKKTGGVQAAGILLTVIGCAGAAVSLVGAGLSLAAGIMTVEYAVAAVGGILGAVFAAGFGAMTGSGVRKLGGIRRFRWYIQGLGGREYCNVKELAHHIGKPEKFVIKDLERMIRKGWFAQGHLDFQKTCLITSNEAYHQYTDLMSRYETRRRQEEEEQKSRKAETFEQKQNLSPQVREVIQSGEEYLRKIHLCNDAIPGEEISAKISRIEMLVDKIFDRVEQAPELVSDIRRMMEYYLPTTVKLLEAYQELDAQPIQGENIVTSKREIEKTLDTLNIAFEKLLDGLFQDTAWDLSSDISVLHTMLAQEGLTEDEPFRKKADHDK